MIKIWKVNGRQTTDAKWWQKLTLPLARWAKNLPIRNRNCLWRPCLLMDRDEMSNLYRGPSIDASYQVSVHLAEGFQRRRLKCEKLTDDRRRTPSDGKSSHCLWQGELKMKLKLDWSMPKHRTWSPEVKVRTVVCYLYMSHIFYTKLRTILTCSFREEDPMGSCFFAKWRNKKSL